MLICILAHYNLCIHNLLTVCLWMCTGGKDIFEWSACICIRVCVCLYVYLHTIIYVYTICRRCVCGCVQVVKIFWRVQRVYVYVCVYVYM